MPIQQIKNPESLFKVLGGYLLKEKPAQAGGILGLDMRTMARTTPAVAEPYPRPIKEKAREIITGLAPIIKPTVEKIVVEGKPFLQAYKETWQELNKKEREIEDVVKEQIQEAQARGASQWEVSKIAETSPAFQRLAMSAVYFSAGMQMIPKGAKIITPVARSMLKKAMPNAKKFVKLNPTVRGVKELYNYFKSVVKTGVIDTRLEQIILRKVAPQAGVPSTQIAVVVSKFSKAIVAKPALVQFTKDITAQAPAISAAIKGLVQVPKIVPKPPIPKPEVAAPKAKPVSYTPGGIPVYSSKDIKIKRIVPEIKKYATAEEFIKAKGLDPASVDIKDNKNFIVENSAGNEATLTEIPLARFEQPKFETVAKYEAGKRITAPIEATVVNGEYRITDGANRFTQAVANKDKTIPVVLEKEVKPAVPKTPEAEFEQYLERTFKDITPKEEQAVLSFEFQKEFEAIKKTTGNQLYKDIKALGGIKSYRGKFMAEELAPIPLTLRNNITGIGLDEMADTLANKGYNFESDSDLLEAILRIGEMERPARIIKPTVPSVVKALNIMAKKTPEATATISRRLLNKLHRAKYPKVPATYKSAVRALKAGKIQAIPKEIQRLMMTTEQKAQERFTQSFETQKENLNVKPTDIKAKSDKVGNTLPDDELYRYEEAYSKKRVDKIRGYTAEFKKKLKEAGVRPEVISSLEIENKLLEDIVKIKREPATGQISATISGGGLDYIDRTKRFTGEPEWFKTWSLKNIKRTAGSILQGFETGARFFERLGKGYKNLVFDPIRTGERLSIERYFLLKENQLSSVFDLTKKQAEELWYFTAQRQGKGVPAKTWNELAPEVQRAYIDVLRTGQELYPEVRETAVRNGRTIGKVKNYTPLYTRKDIVATGQGKWGWVRKDPYFGSLEERVPEVPIEAYEKDYRKVVDTWAFTASKYIDLGRRTVPVKYMIESEEFAKITGPEITKQIKEWYDFLVNPPTLDPIRKGIRIARATQAVRLLTQPFVVAKQMLNLFDGWVLSNIPSMLRAVKTISGRNALSELTRTSGSIRERGVGLSVRDLQHTVLKWLRKPTEFTDRLTAKVLFASFLDNSLRRAQTSGLELTPKIVRGAKREASDLVDAIMGEMSRAGTPRYWRTEEGKAALMFYSQLNAKAQFYARDIPKKYRKSWAKAIVGLLLGVYAEYVINRLAFTDEPVEMAKDNLKTLVGNLPLLGSLSFSLTTGQPFYGSPILQGFGKLAIAIGKGSTEDIVWQTLGLVGVPEQIKRTWQGWQVVKEEGLITKAGRLLYPVKSWPEKIRTLLKGRYASLEAKKYFREKDKKTEGIDWSKYLPGAQTPQKIDWAKYR